MTEGKQTLRFGIDLGGTKIEIIGLAVTAEKTSNTVYKKRIPTPKGDYEATIKALKELVLEAESSLFAGASQPLFAQPALVGVAIPGAISYKTGKVKNANSTWLIGQDLQFDLALALDRPVNLANDANCFALSEAVDGSAEGADVVFGVILGTGCGGAVVVNGHILGGVNAIAGEWGHNPLPWSSPQDIQLPCYCGLQGCNETFLSGSGFERHFLHRTGLEKTVQEILLLSEQNDLVAEQLLQDYIVWLAKGLASVINIVDPDVIVLGGGLSNIQRLYTEVPKVWENWVFSDRVDTKLVPPEHGDSSGVRGAAWL